MRKAVYRFGRFVVDTQERALMKDGVRLAIQEQPYQVLLALLEQPGNVVTREGLRLRLWGTNTFVDFDQSLNSAVRRLRLALEDDSRNPTYVETIPRIGFRFLPASARENGPRPHTEVPCPSAAAAPVTELRIAAVGRETQNETVAWQ